MNKYFAAEDSDSTYIPEVVPGFDKPPAVAGGEEISANIRTTEVFRYQIQQAKKLIDPEVNTIFVTSWNEWAENTAVEPGKEWGNDYINM